MLDGGTWRGISHWRAHQFAVIQAAAPSLRVEVNPVNVGHAAEIERAVAAFVRPPDGGLIATGGGRMRSHRDLIVKLAARHKLPAVYYDRVYVDAGGLFSDGPDFVDQYRRAAVYVDHILRREARGPAGASTHQVRNGHQRPDRQNARTCRAG